MRGDGLRREEALAGAFYGGRRDAQPAPGRADAVRRLALPLASPSFSLCVVAYACCCYVVLLYDVAVLLLL